MNTHACFQVADIVVCIGYSGARPMNQCLALNHCVGIIFWCKSSWPAKRDGMRQERMCVYIQMLISGDNNIAEFLRNPVKSVWVAFDTTPGSHHTAGSRCCQVMGCKCRHDYMSECHQTTSCRRRWSFRRRGSSWQYGICGMVGNVESLRPYFLR